MDDKQQLNLLDVMEYFDCTPSHAQSIKLKRDDFREYFPAGYSEEQIKKDILHGLELLK